MIPVLEALEQLRRGNRRFMAGRGEAYQQIDQSHLREHVDGQTPIAVVLGCSDSRVPLEAVFDQGLGRLFVVRVAGNIAGSSQIGSIEYAVQQLGTRLVVVLGHTRCGAVRATVEAVQRPGGVASEHLRGVVDAIRPSVEALRATDGDGDVEAWAKRAVRANVRAVVRRLREDSQVIASLIQTDGLRVVGAEYALETGVVDFFEAVPVS